MINGFFLDRSFQKLLEPTQISKKKIFYFSKWVKITTLKPQKINKNITSSDHKFANQKQFNWKTNIHILEL